MQTRSGCLPACTFPQCTNLGDRYEDGAMGREGHKRQSSSGRQNVIDWKYPHNFDLAGVIIECVFSDDFIMANDGVHLVYDVIYEFLYLRRHSQKFHES